MKLWVTITPLYPAAHYHLFTSREVCDATWGKKWTRRVKVRVTY